MRFIAEEDSTADQAQEYPAGYRRAVVAVHTVAGLGLGIRTAAGGPGMPAGERGFQPGRGARFVEDMAEECMLAQRYGTAGAVAAGREHQFAERKVEAGHPSLGRSGRSSRGWRCSLRGSCWLRAIDGRCGRGRRE